MSLLDIRDMRELCRHSQLVSLEPCINVALPNILSHCERELKGPGGQWL